MEKFALVTSRARGRFGRVGGMSGTGVKGYANCLVAWIRRYTAGVSLFIMAVGCTATSCGGRTARPRADGGNTDGDAPSEGGMDGSVACLPSAQTAEADASALIILDGGVPLDRVALSLAVARCKYWGRCSPLAAYVVGQCIDAVSQAGSWHFTNCTERGMGNRQCVALAIEFPFPSARVFQAVREGLVRYDPQQESACLQMLLAQSCHGADLWENIPACASTFTCTQNAEAADGGSSVGDAVDGGTICSTLLEPWVTTPGETLLPCSAASDCAEAVWPGGPYCVDGYCAPGLLGDSNYCRFADGVRCEFVDSGEPCDSDAPFLGSAMFATLWGASPTKICSPGLTCRGLTSDGGLGVCSTAQGVGGPCTQDAAITGCGIGLVCQCGICQIPPSRGPCAAGSCQAGVAYCDLVSNTCIPTKQLDGDCTDGPQACPPSLECSSANTCEPYSP